VSPVGPKECGGSVDAVGCVEVGRQNVGRKTFSSLQEYGREGMRFGQDVLVVM
jgi:hypothetical protein